MSHSDYIMPLWAFELLDYLAYSGLNNSSVETILQYFSTSIRENGIPLKRTGTGNFIIHPLYCARVFEWSYDSDHVNSEYLDRSSLTSGIMQNSPFFYMRTNNIPILRYDLTKSYAESNFPIFSELKEKGYSDYLGVFYSYGTQGLTFRSDDVRSVINEGFACSFTTDEKGGFSESDIKLLTMLSSHLALAIRIKLLIEISSVITTTYVGKRTAQRVLSGEINRGAIDKINAIIWYGDLKGFTKANDTISAEVLIPTLNNYLDLISSSVIEEGGEILKYIGDGVLAIFELPDLPDKSAMAALRAAEQVLRKVSAYNRKYSHELTFEIDLVLHTGMVSYGNIGAAERLDFTVIGPAVNEASRMEAYCDICDTNLILSKEFTDLIPDCKQNVISLGKRMLKGVKKEKELFTLKPSELDK